KTEVEESPLRLAHESVRARKEEQCPLRGWCTSPQVAVTPPLGQRDSGHLAVPSSARWSGTEPALSRRMWWNEAVGKPRRQGCMRTSALASPKMGRPME